MQFLYASLSELKLQNSNFWDLNHNEYVYYPHFHPHSSLKPQNYVLKYKLLHKYVLIIRYRVCRSADNCVSIKHRDLIYFLVDGGHRAVIFDRFAGIKNQVTGEGTHFYIPWVQRPIMFDIRSRPRNIPVVTGSKGKNLEYLAKGWH